MQYKMNVELKSNQKKSPIIGTQINDITFFLKL
jgi:hypothetical protein